MGYVVVQDAVAEAADVVTVSKYDELQFLVYMTFGLIVLMTVVLHLIHHLPAPQLPIEATPTGPKPQVPPDLLALMGRRTFGQLLALADEMDALAKIRRARQRLERNVFLRWFDWAYLSELGRLRRKEREQMKHVPLGCRAWSAEQLDGKATQIRKFVYT